MSWFQEYLRLIKIVTDTYANGILITGCSMGATHAVNFMFRRPDIFDGCIGLSGYYDSDFVFYDYCDDLVYKNALIKYIEGMPYDHEFVDKYRKQDKMVICCGQGAWEDEMIYSTNKLKKILEHKNIGAWVDFWGTDKPWLGLVESSVTIFSCEKNIIDIIYKI